LKKIFITIPWFHPAFKAGGPIQSIAGIVKQLDELEFNIFCGNKDMDGSVTDVPCDQWVEYSANTRVWYSADNNILPVLKKEYSEQYPAFLFVVGLYDWNYNFKPLLLCRKINKIISVRGMLHPGALSQKSFKKKVYLSLWKLLGWNKKYLFHVTDDKEKNYVSDVMGKSTRVAVAGNFPILFNKSEMPLKEPGILQLVSVALISPMKNHLLVLQALRMVSSGQLAVSRIEYNIYGPVKDEAYWEKCLQLIRQMPENVVVNYHGAVLPAEIAHAISKNHVFILPSKSENYGHSIIEALSVGRPVITSNATPWNNLQDTKAGINADVKNINELAGAIDHFVKMNQGEINEWGDGANVYAGKATDIEKIKEQYRQMFGVSVKH
jgi:glycosyltransferase involved in cell wall biosynthesis